MARVLPVRQVTTNPTATKNVSVHWMCAARELTEPAVVCVTTQNVGDYIVKILVIAQTVFVMLLLELVLSVMLDIME